MKIMYVHGLSSSGSSHTVATLRKHLPDDIVISPDLPLDPQSALKLLKDLVLDENLELVIGTSMGGMFSQKLFGVNKILVNPAFHVSEFMRARLGVHPFFNPRMDGASHFEITPELCDAYALIEASQFDGIDSCERENTVGLFGWEDDVVDCRAEYLSHYKHCSYFHGGHRLNEEVIKEHLLPLIELFRRQR